MAIKAKISAAEYDKLSDDMKSAYKKDGDNYVLDADGMDDPAELRRARDREKEAARVAREEADAAKKRADEAEAKLSEGETTDARKKGDIAALEKSWKDKADKIEADGNAEADKLRGQMRNLLVRDKARELADAISTAPDLILPHIESRLSAEFEGDMPVTRVLDVDGKPSAASMDDLRKELVATSKFAPIIKASSASGGGAGNGGGSNGGGASDKKFGDMNERERIEFYNRDPAAFQKAADEHKAQLANPAKK